MITNGASLLFLVQAVLVLLASPEAEFIQGQVIFINGGANFSA